MLFVEVHVTVVFVKSCLPRSMSLTRVREWRFIRTIDYYSYSNHYMGRDRDQKVDQTPNSHPHSEHRFPAPSSKLCQIWLRK